MANSWSFLSDAMDEQKDDVTLLGGESEDTKNDFWMDDGYSLTGNPGAAQDTITFSSDVVAAGPVPLPWSAAGQDVISFYDDFELPLPKQETNIMNKDSNRYKYSEDVILKELTDYISGTYNQHYSAGDDKIQTLDLIEACGDGESFCRSNILKYASRYDKKGTARRDILKILHYAVLLMHFNDKNAQRETYPQ